MVPDFPNLVAVTGDWAGCWSTLRTIWFSFFLSLENGNDRRWQKELLFARNPRDRGQILQNTWRHRKGENWALFSPGIVLGCSLLLELAEAGWRKMGEEGDPHECAAWTKTSIFIILFLFWLLQIRLKTLQLCPPPSWGENFPLLAQPGRVCW